MLEVGASAGDTRDFFLRNLSDRTQGLYLREVYWCEEFLPLELFEFWDGLFEVEASFVAR